MASRLSLIAVSLLLLAGCGAGEELLVPSQETTGAKVQGLLHDGGGDLVEQEVVQLHALYDAETSRAPDWFATGGDLRTNGQSVRWRLPEPGRHTLTLRLYLVDGSQAEASWTVDVKPRGTPQK